MADETQVRAEQIEPFGSIVVIEIDEDFFSARRARMEEFEQTHGTRKRGRATRRPDAVVGGELTQEQIDAEFIGPPLLPVAVEDLSPFTSDYWPGVVRSVPATVLREQEQSFAEGVDEKLEQVASIMLRAMNAQRGTPAPVEVGDRVLFRQHSASPLPLPGTERLVMVDATQIIARLNS